MTFFTPTDTSLNSTALTQSSVAWKDGYILGNQNLMRLTKNSYVNWSE